MTRQRVEFAPVAADAGVVRGEVRMVVGDVCVECGGRARRPCAEVAAGRIEDQRQPFHPDNVLRSRDAALRVVAQTRAVDERRYAVAGAQVEQPMPARGRRRGRECAAQQRQNAGRGRRRVTGSCGRGEGGRPASVSGDVLLGQRDELDHEFV
jgi:hypothetical protein